MIIGKFGEIGELLFEIELVNSAGERFPIEVLLDTGFTSGLLAIDLQDAESLGWLAIERNRSMLTAKGEEFFDVYEGRIYLDEEEFVIPVLAGDHLPEPLLGLQWLKIFPLTVNFSAGILTLGIPK